MQTLPIPVDVVLDHFTARAGHYDRSSRWCTDQDLLDRLVELAAPTPSSTLLDVAVGTGLVARAFLGKVGRIVGLDLTAAMAEQAKDTLDELVLGRAEHLPFPDATFDLVTCRQGIQFMDAPAALAEMVRVLKPGGRVLTVDLCAFGEDDRAEYFEILRLRNPARRNFFVKGDVEALFRQAGCAEVHTHEYITHEDVDVWSDNHAIEEERREGIRRVYRNATPAFAALHGVKLEGGRILDAMLFTLTLGVK